MEKEDWVNKQQIRMSVWDTMMDESFYTSLINFIPPFDRKAHPLGLSINFSFESITYKLNTFSNILLK